MFSKIIIIIVVLLITIYIRTQPIIENYDVVQSDSSAFICGDRCRSTEGCAGFGFSQKDKKCYLSKSFILGEPTTAFYKNEYKNSDTNCNKVSMISSRDITESGRKRNNAFVCVDKDKSSRIFYFKKDNVLLLNSTDDINKVSDDNIYDIQPFNWDKKVDIISEPEVQKINVCDVHDKKYNTFRMYNRIYDGDYLWDQKCASDISFEQCYKNCKENNDCVGFQYASVLIKDTDNKDNVKDIYKNVCCPLKSKGKYTETTADNSYWKYYDKQDSTILPSDMMFIS